MIITTRIDVWVMREILDPFKVKNDLRHRDVLTSVLFNLALK